LRPGGFAGESERGRDFKHGVYTPAFNGLWGGAKVVGLARRSEGKEKNWWWIAFE